MTNKLIIKRADARKVEIFIAGDLETATRVCQAYCDRVGLCVTVEATNYIFTGGSEMGVRVGLINYARFPSSRDDLWTKAEDLANDMKAWMGQGSFTIQDDAESVFYSTRDQDQ